MFNNQMSHFAQTTLNEKYAHTKQNGEKETWVEVAERVVKSVIKVNPTTANANLADILFKAIRDRKFIPGGRYLASCGRSYHQVNNCFMFRAEDSREGWAELLYKSSLSLMTGGGIGIDYSPIRPYGSPINKTSGFSSGPLALMQMVNEAGRFIRQGGNRRAAIWAGLNWNHPDVFNFIALKDWNQQVKLHKEFDYNNPAPLDGTNVSVLLDDEFFYSIKANSSNATNVYWQTVRAMLRHGEPGFSVDCGSNNGETLRNACTELTSHDDSDVCNLGSLNLARIESLDEMRELVDVATAFLLAGTLYSDLPFTSIREVRDKNRRLGLGLMGIHEWLISRNKPYGPDDELAQYLAIYQTSGECANIWADKWKISHPVKTRAIAPTGTIGIIGETTTGIEPIFCVSYKRRYLVGDTLSYQYVIDPTAKRLIEQGTKPDTIEDALTLAADPERRVAFQAWVQQYVDHAISSTINLPAWGTELNNESKVISFGEMLLKYLPQLRGITVYPDGARSGQPLTKVDYNEAVRQVGQVFVETTDVCDLSRGESCGA